MTQPPLHPTEPQASARVIWRITDGKPGHENQSLGLVQALAERLPVETHDIPALSALRASAAWLGGRPAVAPHKKSHSRTPDLILCAGHGTHLTALAARRQHGGRLVVLMKPSLPLPLFDLCLVPDHDRVSPRPPVVKTRGVLNRVRPSGQQDPNRGLILLGGPSRHGDWDNEHALTQIAAIAAKDPRLWLVADSRRTPPELLQQVAELPYANLKPVPHGDVGGDWLAAQYGTASAIWVSEDSVSMIYEALSSGAACGLIALPAVNPTRVRKGVERLLQDGLLIHVDEWRQGQALPRPDPPLQEAQRCARLITDLWLST